MEEINLDLFCRLRSCFYRRLKKAVLWMYWVEKGRMRRVSSVEGCLGDEWGRGWGSSAGMVLLVIRLACKSAVRLIDVWWQYCGSAWVSYSMAELLQAMWSTGCFGYIFGSWSNLQAQKRRGKRKVIKWNPSKDLPVINFRPKQSQLNDS